MSYEQPRPNSCSDGRNNQFYNAYRPRQPFEGFQSRPMWPNQGNNGNHWAPQFHNNPQNGTQNQLSNSSKFSHPPPLNFQNNPTLNQYPRGHNNMNLPQNHSPYLPPPPIPANIPFYGSNQAAAPHHTSNIPRPPFPLNINLDKPPPPVVNAFMQPPPPTNVPFSAPYPTLGNSENMRAMTNISQSQKPVVDKAVGFTKLENWLQLKKKHLKPQLKANWTEERSSVKVSDYVNKLQEMLDLINSLSTQVAGLASAALQTDETTWEASKEACVSIKEKISNEYGWLLEDKTVEVADRKLKQIRHKRARIKRARKTNFEETQYLHQQWNEKSKSIDRWQERLRFKIQEENKEKQQKAAADRTLSKVTREIQDATRLIDTMLGLEKLRLIRRDAAQKRGDHDIGESRQSFEDKIKDMTRLVKAQLECYKEEESKLKRILKSEEEEKTKLECKSREEKARREQEEEDSNLKLILFGRDESLSLDSPLYPFSQYYRQANHSLAAFLQIRHDWDSYLVPKGTPASSYIPSTWVTPDPPNSSSWSAFLQ